jgi:sugar-specific transcriptional regulator TrmB
VNLFIDEYRRELRSLIAEHERQVRKASDWNDFKRREGVILGMERALDLMGELLKAAKLKAGEEDDEE